MNTIKKYKGYIILSIIFIIIIFIVYLSSGKKEIQYINVPDTSYRAHIVDSLEFIISDLKEEIINIKNNKEIIKIKIKENESEYKNKIKIIEHTCADSNYNALREMLRAEQ